MLEKLVLDKLNEQIEKAGEIQYSAKTENKQTVNAKRLELMIEKNVRMKRSLYEDYKEGILSKEEYLLYKSDYQKEEELLRGQLSSITQENAKKDKEMSEWVETLLKHKKIDKLDRETVGEVLDKIIITDNDGEIGIEIRFKFALELL